MTRLAAFLAGLLLLVACSSPPKSGEVVAKEHTDSYVYFVSVCMTWGQYGCTMSMLMPATEPAHWKLKVRDDADPGHSGWVEVLQEQFDRYQVGGHWPDPR